MSSEKYQEELKQYLSNNYMNQILDQLNQPAAHQSVRHVQITFDLSLLVETRPLLGSWIINFYPLFLHSVTNIVHQLKTQYCSSQIQEVICDIKFIRIPPFNTALHDPNYQLTLMEKQCGSLIHIKNCIIVHIEPSKNYLQLQELQCFCEQIKIKTYNLISQIKHHSKQLQYCKVCGKNYKEIYRKYQSCQKILVFLQDLSPFNKKYGNFQINDKSKSYKFETNYIEMYLDTNYVNKFSIGQHLYSLSYYFFKIDDINFRRQQTVKLQQYLYAVNIEGYNTVINKRYFNNLKCSFKFDQSQQIDPYDINEDIKILLDQSKQHATYDRNNFQFIYQILKTTILMTDQFARNLIDSNSLFSLKLSLMCSIFLENKHFMDFYSQSNLSNRSNILFSKTSSSETRQHLNLGIIYEDFELLFDLIKELTDDLENIIILPDCDAETFDLLILNLVNGGILIIPKPISNKSVQFKVNSILQNQPVEFNKEHIQIQCSVWQLFHYQELMTKNTDSSRFDQATIVCLKDKYHNTQDYFDIVLDITYSNLKQKGAILQSNQDYCNQFFQQMVQNSGTDQYCTTIKKNQVHKAPSSYYFIQQQQQTIKQIYDSEIRLQQSKDIDNDSVTILQDFYLRLRQKCNCNSKTQTNLIKIAVSISLIRNFVYSQLDDQEGFYRQLLCQGSQIPLNFSDAFLAILLTIETRINIFGAIGAIFGSDTTNYLLNTLNCQVQLRKLQKTENADIQDASFDNFQYIYEKIINY